jgi:hypothetical protein
MKHPVGFLVVLLVGLAALAFVRHLALPGCKCGCSCERPVTVSGPWGIRERCRCNPMKRCDSPCCDCLALPCRGGEK